jgi:hypothetical protein
LNESTGKTAGVSCSTLSCVSAGSPASVVRERRLHVRARVEVEHDLRCAAQRLGADALQARRGRDGLLERLRDGDEHPADRLVAAFRDDGDARERDARIDAASRRQRRLEPGGDAEPEQHEQGPPVRKDEPDELHFGDSGFSSLFSSSFFSGECVFAPSGRL